MCVYLWVCAHEHRYLWRPEEGAETQGAGVIGDCEAPDVDAGTRAQALCKEQVALFTAESTIFAYSASPLSDNKHLQGSSLLSCGDKRGA